MRCCRLTKRMREFFFLFVIIKCEMLHSILFVTNFQFEKNRFSRNNNKTGFSITLFLFLNSQFFWLWSRRSILFSWRYWCIAFGLNCFGNTLPDVIEGILTYGKTKIKIKLKIQYFFFRQRLSCYTPK